MNFYEYFDETEEMENPALAAALDLEKMGFKVLPCTGKEPTKQFSKGVKQVNVLRSRPLNEKNIPFYFSEPHNIAVLTGDQFEVVDIDSKYDLTGSIYKNLCRAIQYTLPEVWDKIVIQRSANKGYHFFYRCPQIAGPLIFAQRPATGPEISKGERIKTLIESRGEGGYIMICPTPGYKFVKGNPETIQSITPEQRSEMHAICKSFTKIHQPVISQFSTKQNGREDAPWNVFNNRNGYEYTLSELVKRGWENIRDDQDKILVLRPGSNAKSSGVVWKDTGILYLFSTSTEFESGIGNTPFNVHCKLNYEGNFKECCRQLAEQGIGSFGSDDGEFYSISDKGKIKSKLREIVNWLNDIGIRKYVISPAAYEIVQVVDNRVSLTDLGTIKKIFCSYIHETCNEQIDDFFLKAFTTIFNKEGIINLVNPIDNSHFIRPTKDQAYILFKNACILVTSSDIKYLNYSSLPALVWESNVIQREIKPATVPAEVAKFISNISDDDPARVNMLRSLIGYMLHPFKDPANPKVGILNDEFFDENSVEPQGGTGKGMVIKLLSHFRNIVTIDGKTFSFDKSFMYQRVAPGTEIVCFEDVRKGFDFEKLFSVITEDWTIERKGLLEYTIPFEMSPKLLITSNYAIKGSSASHLRRRYEVEISKHYSHLYTVRDEFGHLFFEEWDTDQWASFDNFMLDCLQFYLTGGLVTQQHINLKVKRLIEETCIDFCRWIDSENIEVGKKTKEDFMLRFTTLYPDWIRNKLSQSQFTRWLNKYCDVQGIEMDASNSYNGKMVYHFKKVPIKRRLFSSGFPNDMQVNNISSGFIEPREEIKEDEQLPF